MNRKKIRAAILACVLITGIAFLAIHYSEPSKTLLGDNGDSGQYNTIQSETAGENEGSKMIDKNTISRGKGSRTSNDQSSESPSAESEASAKMTGDAKPAAADQGKDDAVIPDEPDISEPMNSDIDKAKEASSEAVDQAVEEVDQAEEEVDQAVEEVDQALLPALAEQETTEAASDLDLLARLITAEAQGEPYEAQVAVGAVVMNRVESSSWPDSIEGVIYQEIDGFYQFTPVVNGWIDKPAQEQSIRAAKEVLEGTDPTKGAQFYYDDTTTNPWILAKTVSVQIGRMIFAF